MPTKQGAFGGLLWANSRPINRIGLHGRILMGEPPDKGLGLYGVVKFYPFADGFHGETLTVAELYTITLQDGSLVRVTSHGEDITYSGDLYQAVPMRRGQIRMHSDLQVDKVDVEMGIIGALIGGQNYTVPQVIKRGLLRQARVRIVAVDYEKLDSEKFRFDGFVTDTIGYNSGVLSLKVGSILDRLNDKFPKLIYSEFCPHKLFGSYCGLSAAAYKTSGTTLSGLGFGASVIYADAFLFSNQPENYWTRGELKITDPASDEYDISRTILDHGDGYVRMLVPFDSAIPAGVSFDVWPGCDKSGRTCDEKFNNYANFLGFEYIPRPEVLQG